MGEDKAKEGERHTQKAAHYQEKLDGGKGDGANRGIS